jgi:hypothetical protein
MEREKSLWRAGTRVARSFENRTFLDAIEHFWARAMGGLDAAAEEPAASKVAVRALAAALVGGGRAVAAGAAGVPPLARWVGLTLLADTRKAVCAGAALDAGGGGASRPLAVLKLGDAWSAAAAARGGALAWASTGHPAAAAGPRDLPEPRCARYVAAAAPLECGATCVFVLGFDASGAGAEAALAAAVRALAAAVAEHAGRELAAALGAILPLIAAPAPEAPPPPPSQARRHARAAARAAARASSRLTLRFADAALEARFLAWRNGQLASLDLASLLLNQGFLASQIFMPGAFHLAAKLGALRCSLPSLLARSELALLPPLALLRPRTRAAYLRRRELVVCAMLACATSFHASVRNFVDVLDASMMTLPVSSAASLSCQSKQKTNQPLTNYRPPKHHRCTTMGSTTSLSWRSCSRSASSSSRRSCRRSLR